MEGSQSTGKGNKMAVGNNTNLDDDELTVKVEKKGSIMSFFSQKMNTEADTESCHSIKSDELNADKNQVKHEGVKENDNSLMSFFKRKQLENQTSLKSGCNNGGNKQRQSTSSGQGSSFFAQKFEKSQFNSRSDLSEPRLEISAKLKESATDLSADTECEIEEISDVDNDDTDEKMGKEEHEISIGNTKCEENNGNSESKGETDNSNFPAEDFMQCEKCDKLIVVWEMPEHMDFHFAMDLQRNMNTEDRNSATQSLSSHVKRKSTGDSERTSKRVKVDSSQGKLDTFFMKQNRH